MLRIPQKKDAIKINNSSNHLLISLNNSLKCLIEATGCKMHVPIILYEVDCFFNMFGFLSSACHQIC